MYIARPTYRERCSRAPLTLSISCSTLFLVFCPALAKTDMLSWWFVTIIRNYIDWRCNMTRLAVTTSHYHWVWDLGVASASAKEHTFTVQWIENYPGVYSLISEQWFKEWSNNCVILVGDSHNRKILLWNTLSPLLFTLQYISISSHFSTQQIVTKKGHNWFFHSLKTFSPFFFLLPQDLLWQNVTNFCTFLFRSWSQHL